MCLLSKLKTKLKECYWAMKMHYVDSVHPHRPKRSIVSTAVLPQSVHKKSLLSTDWDDAFKWHITWSEWFIKNKEGKKFIYWVYISNLMIHTETSYLSALINKTEQLSVINLAFPMVL